MPIPFELRPDMPEEGFSAIENGLTHSEHVEARLLKDAAESGHPMVLLDHIPKTHLAMVLGEVARDHGTEVHAGVHATIFSAYYGDGRDIGTREVLLDIAREHDIGPEEVVSAWDRGTYTERLKTFANVAMTLGVSTTPAALVCEHLIVGTRPYGVLRDAMATCVPDDRQHSDA